MNKTTCQFPVFTIKIDFQNMPASSKVRFENSLNSLHSTFAAKTSSHTSNVMPWNEVFYKEWVEEFQAFTIKIDFRNMFASVEVRF